MKNKILLLFLTAGLMSGCNLYEDDIFDKSPDIRIQEKVSEYRDVLTSSPNGWFLSVNTGYGGGYTHWVNFDDKDKSVMLSDFDATSSKHPNTSKVLLESTYRLKAVQTPSLIFDTYNYVHLLSDPQSGEDGGLPGTGGEVGKGYTSDFEYYIRHVDNGCMKLKGRYNGKDAVLTPASAAESAAAISNGGLKKVHEKTEAFINTVAFFVADIEGAEVWFKPATRSLTAIYTMDKSKTSTSVTEGVYIDQLPMISDAPTSNIHLFNPITIDGSKIVSLNWNNSEGKYYAINEAGKSYPVNSSGTPPIDLDFGYLKSFSKMRLSDVILSSVNEPFMSKYQDTHNRLLSTARTILWVEIRFMNHPDGYPVMELGVYYQSASKYEAKWRFKYIDNEDGTITFIDRDQTGSSNERNTEQHCKAILDYFCNVEYTYSPSNVAYTSWIKGTITPRTFKFNWYKNSTPGSAANLGGAYPADSPTDNFCGVLAK